MFLPLFACQNGSDVLYLAFGIVEPHLEGYVNLLFFLDLNMEERGLPLLALELVELVVEASTKMTDGKETKVMKKVLIRYGKLIELLVGG